MGRYSSLTIAVMLSIALIGCATVKRDDTNLGKSSKSSEVTDSYKSYDLDPAYNYYYCGSEFNPEAIIGIRTEYDVQSNFWKQIDLTKGQLESWVTWGERQSSGESFSNGFAGFQGGYILDPDGNVVGNWYSKNELGTLYFPGDSVLIPYPPTNSAGTKGCEHL